MDPILSLRVCLIEIPKPKREYQDAGRSCKVHVRPPPQCFKYKPMGLEFEVVIGGDLDSNQSLYLFYSLVTFRPINHSGIESGRDQLRWVFGYLLLYILTDEHNPRTGFT
jgi:hypothetical protein